MDFNELERLINNIASNPDVIKLMGEIEAIGEGKDSKAKLLAFLPIIAKIVYEIIDKDNLHGDEFEFVQSLAQLLLNQVEKNKISHQ